MVQRKHGQWMRAKYIRRKENGTMTAIFCESNNRELGNLKVLLAWIKDFLGLKACSRACSEQVLKLNCWSSKLCKLFTPFTNLIKEIENSAQKYKMLTKREGSKEEKWYREFPDTCKKVI